MKENPLYDKELLQAMLLMREHDPAGFMQMVLTAIKNHPDLAVSDVAPAENKVRALERMLKHFEEIENYEDCEFIFNLKKKIEDGSKE
jgi:tellurite resistance protein